MLSLEELEFFNREGYLVVENVIDQSTISAVLREMNTEVLTPLVENLFQIGSVTSLYKDLSLEARIQAISSESEKSFPQHFDCSLPQSDITTDTPLYLGEHLFNVLRHEKLVSLIVELLQTVEISSNPVQHVRLKLPQQITNKISQHSKFSGMVNPVPWHQDAGVILPIADQSNIVTCWVTLTDVSLNSGCMQVIPRSHSNGVYAHTHTTEGLAIAASIIETLLTNGGKHSEVHSDEFSATDDKSLNGNCVMNINATCGAMRGLSAVPLPMKAGSVLFMHRQTIHSSLENTTSDTVRISMDLRYQPTGTRSGRPLFDLAGFVVRSHLCPESELRDYRLWRENWLRLRDKLSSCVLSPHMFNRWSTDSSSSTVDKNL